MRSTQNAIIRDLEVMPHINPEIEIHRRVEFLADYLAHAGVNGFVLGISGGQDSLLAGILAQRAVDLRRNANHDATFHAVLLPYGEQRDRADAELAIDTIKPDITHDFNIKNATDSLIADFSATTSQELTDYHKGNVKARMQMIAQYALAGQYNLCVVGTDHAAEAVTGFYTKYGDGGADIIPLAGLNKRQGRQILAHLKVPDIFITKQPTADLLDTTPGQSDENELGIPYNEIDNYLEGRAVPEHVAEAIEERYNATWHKRTMPVAFTHNHFL